jgi:phospho-N-acetylmuramoyl-pentapeptide-transferase
MLLLPSRPLAKDHIVFNVFRYLTFRSLHGADHGVHRSRWCRSCGHRHVFGCAQHGGETIREDTPERHRTKKGTPTMGGIVILTAILAHDLAVGESRATATCGWSILSTSGFGLIGVWDDMTKLRKRKGLPPA